jgi:acyl-CoA reductase-like NAD-dependent aldehyde dehydrogenase
MQVNLDVPEAKLYIGERTTGSGSGGVHHHVYAPTGVHHGDVPLAGPSDVDEAVRAAVAASKKWRSTKPATRRDVLLRLGQSMKDHTDELIRLSIIDNGMTVNFARFLTASSIDWVNYYAGWADKLDGRVVSSPGQRRDLAYTLPEPYGVIGVIITWNGPLISLGMKVVPALAAGNAVVIKPSELTPYAVELFVKLALEAGVPPGVINLLPGTGEAGQALVAHPDVHKISFTGGPATARKILATCAEGLKPAVLELGGKSANLVFEDADVQTACWLAVYSSVISLSGQGCAMPTRLLAHRSVYDDVLARVTTQVAGIKLGEPFDESSDSGPVVTRGAQQRILGMIQRTVEGKTGRLLIGGGAPGGDLADGFYVEPTVFADVDPASEIAQIEVFGPVLSVIPFDDDDQGIAIANSTPYGLASYAWTNNVKRCHRLIGELRAGGVYINGAQPVVAPELPFGGMGVSGFGREGGREGIDEFIRTKAVGIA